MFGVRNYMNSRELDTHSVIRDVELKTQLMRARASLKVHVQQAQTLCKHEKSKCFPCSSHDEVSTLFPHLMNFSSLLFARVFPHLFYTHRAQLSSTRRQRKLSSCSLQSLMRERSTKSPNIVFPQTRCAIKCNKIFTAIP